MPKLTIATGDEPWVYEIFPDEPEVTLGRGAANKVQIHDGTASKHHVALRRIEGHWKLIDLESRNGVRVNGRYRNQAWLSDGDTLHVGEVVVQYAAEGDPSGMPEVYASRVGAQAPAVAVAPAPVKPASRTLEEVAIPAAPAAPASRPVRSVPAPAPAAAAPAAGAAFPQAPTRGGAPSRRRARDDYDDHDDYDDERPARRRKNSNSGMIVVLGILGAAAFAGLMIFLMSPGTNPNFKVRVNAGALAGQGDYEGAIAYAQKHGRRGSPYYDEVEADIRNWKGLIAMRPDMERNGKANTVFERTIVQRARVTEPGGFKAKDAETQEEIARRCRAFLQEYAGTYMADRLVSSDLVPYTVFREWMREHAKGEGNPASIVDAAERELGVTLSNQHFGTAIKSMNYLKASQALMLEPARAKEVRRLADEAIVRIKRKARSDWDEVKRRVDGMLRDGQRAQARQSLERVKETFGVPGILDEVEARLDDL